MSTYNSLECTDDDVSAIISLVNTAMHEDTFHNLIFPPTPDCTAEEQAASRPVWLENLWRVGLSDPDAYLLKAVPAQRPDEIAGFASWMFAPRVSGEAKIESHGPKRTKKTYRRCIWQRSSVRHVRRICARGRSQARKCENSSAGSVKGMLSPHDAGDASGSFEEGHCVDALSMGWGTG